MVESSTWHTWSEKRRRDHIASFKAYQPTVSESYQKPKNAGRKPNEFTGARPHGDPDIVVSRIEEEPSTAPIKVNLQKTPKGKHWVCRDCADLKIQEQVLLRYLSFTFVRRYHPASVNVRVTVVRRAPSKIHYW